MFSFKRKTRKTSRSVNRAATIVVSRPAAHERWIPVSELQLGMYVLELNVPWENTGFMFQGFNVDSMKLLKQVVASCDEVLVRSVKVANISSSSASRLCRAAF